MQVVREPQAPETSNTKEWSAWFASLADKTVAIDILDIDPKVFGGLILKEWIADLYEKCCKEEESFIPYHAAFSDVGRDNFLKEYLTRFFFFFFCCCIIYNQAMLFHIFRQQW